MSFQSVLDAGDEHTINFVIQIGTEFFSKHQVDTDTGDIMGTGSKVPTANVGLINQVTINANSIDLTSVRATINSTNISIVEDFEAATFTTFMGASENSLVGDAVQVHVGVVDVAFDFADYVKINDYVIQKVQLTGNKYNITARARQDAMKVPTFDAKGNLSGAISDSGTTIIIQGSGDIFQDDTIIKIEDEYILTGTRSFSAIDDKTTYTGVTRGHLASTAEAHDDEEEAFEYTEVSVNPVTMLLQIMISGSGATGAGAVYDVLHDGLAIDEDLIDIADMESKRTSFFTGDTFRLYLGEIDDTLRFIEDELLLPNQLRLIESQDGISIGVLDQTVPGASLTTLDEDVLGIKPKWKTDKSRVINQFRILWDWKEGTQNFNRITEFNDTDSQSIFGVRKGADLEFKGVQADLGGPALVNTRGNRYLARFSTAQTEITAPKVFLKKFAIKPADKVFFTHSDLPARGGGLGIAAELEIISKAINLNNGQVSFTLAYTSYFNIRLGLIAPSVLATAKTSQSEFTVPDGSCYQAGDFLELWDLTGNVYFADTPREILSVTGDIIILVTPWVTTLDLVNTQIKVARYDSASAFQKARYGFIGITGSDFADGGTAYKIDF